MHLNLQDIGVAYPSRRGTVVALDQLNLTVEPASFVSVLGPSGCGKSTLVRLVAGLLRPSSGVVTCDSVPVVAARSDVGVAFQQAALLPYVSAGAPRLDWGAPDRFGVRQPVVVQPDRQGVLAQMPLHQQQQMAAAQAMMQSNPRLAMQLMEQVNQGAAARAKEANAVLLDALKTGNSAAAQSGSLGLQGASLAESRRHNRAGEGLQQQRLNWEMQRPQGAAGGTSARAPAAFDPAKVRQWFTHDVPTGVGGQTMKQVNEDKYNQFMHALASNPNLQGMSAGDAYLHWQNASNAQSRQKRSAQQQAITPQAIADYAKQNNITPEEVIQRLRDKGYTVP